MTTTKRGGGSAETGRSADAFAAPEAAGGSEAIRRPQPAGVSEATGSSSSSAGSGASRGRGRSRQWFRDLPLSTLLMSIMLFFLLMSLAIHWISQNLVMSLVAEQESIYEKNRQIETLSEIQDGLETQLGSYLGTRRSSALEQYYRHVTDFERECAKLGQSGGRAEAAELEAAIVKLVPPYLERCEDAVRAKRGRNVALYRERYDEARRDGEVIRTYLSCLNETVFHQNSQVAREFSAAIRYVQRNTLRMLILATILMVLVSYVVSRRVSQPLQDLTWAAQAFAQGNESIELDAAGPFLEISRMSEAFNRMVQDLRRAREAREQEAQQAKIVREEARAMHDRLMEAELKSLQMQINPHFLYNIMNTGVQMALLEDAPQTSQYLLHTAKFYRHNLRIGEETGRIREEFELVNHYLYIMNVRYGGEIRFEQKIEVPEAVLAWRMPRMILQPIVENAFVHAFEPGEKAPELTLRIFEAMGELCISIRDNGEGMDEATIRAIFARADDEDQRAPRPEGGLGLDNVISRLRLFYRRKDVLTIASTVGVGTVVTIHLGPEPLEAMREEGSIPPAEAGASVASGDPAQPLVSPASTSSADSTGTLPGSTEVREAPEQFLTPEAKAPPESSESTGSIAGPESFVQDEAPDASDPPETSA